MSEAHEFWMIYGIGQGAPTRAHKTEETALTEAKRLARQHPGVRFVVLRSTHVVEKPDVNVTVIGRFAMSHADLDAGIPF